MSGELQAFVAILARLGRDTLKELAGLPDDLLNRPVNVPDANSLYALATHMVGSSEFLLLELVLGRDQMRDREAEFHATGSFAELQRRFERWFRVMAEAVNGLNDGDLEQPADSRTSTADWLDGTRHTNRDVILHCVDHAALHLGHIQITRQLLMPGEPAGA